MIYNGGRNLSLLKANTCCRLHGCMVCTFNGLERATITTLLKQVAPDHQKPEPSGPWLTHTAFDSSPAIDKYQQLFFSRLLQLHSAAALRCVSTAKIESSPFISLSG